MKARNDDIDFEVFYIKKDTSLYEISNINSRFQRVVLGSPDTLRMQGFIQQPTICVLPDVAAGTLEVFFQQLVSFPRIGICILSDASIDAIKRIPVKLRVKVHLYDISKEAMQALPRGLGAIGIHNVSKDTIPYLTCSGIGIYEDTPRETVQYLPQCVNGVSIHEMTLPSTVEALPWQHIVAVHIYSWSPIYAMVKIPANFETVYIYPGVSEKAIQFLGLRNIKIHIISENVLHESSGNKRERPPEKNEGSNQPQQKRARIAGESAAQVPDLQEKSSSNFFLDIGMSIDKLQQKHEDEKSKFIEQLRRMSDKNNYLENKNNQLLQQVQELSKRNQVLEEENKNLKNPLPPIQPTPIKPSYMPRPEILNSNPPSKPVPQTATRQQGFVPVGSLAIMPSSVRDTHFAKKGVVVKQEPKDQDKENLRQKGSSVTN